MWAIASTEDIKYFDSSDAMVSVLLATRANSGFLSQLSNHFESYNKEMGRSWHLLIPSRLQSHELNGSPLSKPVGPEHLDLDLSSRLIQSFDVKPHNLPAIAFELEKGIVVFKIPSEDPQHLDIIISTLASGIDGFWFENNPDDESRRAFLKSLKTKADLSDMFLTARKRARDPKTWVKLIPIIKSFMKETTP